MTMLLPSSLLLLASTIISSSLAKYTLTRDYSANNFFDPDGFSFFTETDPTGGFVQFQGLEQANASSLAGIINGGNSSNAIYLGVDTTSISQNGRAAVRVVSNDSYQHGLFIADIVHIPTGCGTWPAFWMVGPDWPNNGEIDIVEGVNNMNTNSMALHTGQTSLINRVVNVHGTVDSVDCNVNNQSQPTNVGCQIVDKSNITFGTGFNSQGGGVYAMEWRPEYVKIWFFPRGHIPNDIGASQPQPSSNWGMPRSTFQGNFSMDTFFHDQQIVFDTTFCGGWAGTVWNTSDCASLAPTCNAYVQNNPQAFSEAYWAINRLQVWQDPSLNNTLVLPSSSTSPQKRQAPSHPNARQVRH